MFLMPRDRVCFKPIMCYIEMHHVRVSFPLEDTHAMHEHHVVRKKSWRHSEKNVFTRYFSMCHVTGSKHAQKCYSEGGKKTRGCCGLLGTVMYFLEDNTKKIRAQISIG